MLFRSQHMLLMVIQNIQEQYILDQDVNTVFGNILDTLLLMTESEYGFIGEILNNGEQD